MNLRKMGSSQCVARVVLLAVLCLCAGCRNTDRLLVIRILPPPSSSAFREAVWKLQHFPLATDTGRKILIATLETKDDGQYRMFLQDIQTYRVQIIIVPTRNDIPAPLAGEKSYATLPCSADPSPCVAVLAPWDSREERVAADVVLRHIGLGTPTPDESGSPAQR